MKRLFLFVFLLAAVAIAGSKTYSVTLFQPSLVAGTTLQPGDYKLDLNNGKVVISNSKQSAQSAVKVEELQKKSDTTSVQYATNGGQYRIREIRLGGTKLKLVFD
jgi:hypothetical protein